MKYRFSGEFVASAEGEVEAETYEQALAEAREAVRDPYCWWAEEVQDFWVDPIEDDE